MACLVNDFSSFDTPGGPGGASIVERKDFHTKRPLCIGHMIPGLKMGDSSHRSCSNIIGTLGSYQIYYLVSE